MLCGRTASVSRAALVLALALWAAPAAAQLGNSCTYGTTGPISVADKTGNNIYCNGNTNTYTYPAYWFGSTSTGCTSATAGLVQWTGSVFEGCNGTAWGSLGGGWSASTTLSSLLAATTTNTIDSGNYTQTWEWGTLTTGTALTLTTSSMTGGTLLSLQDTAAAATSTGYVLSVIDATTGTGYGIYSAMTATANTGYALYATNTGAGYALGATGTSTFNGNVGIGTMTPGTMLDLYNGGGAAGIRSNSYVYHTDLMNLKQFSNTIFAVNTDYIDMSGVSDIRLSCPQGGVAANFHRSCSTGNGGTFVSITGPDAFAPTSGTSINVNMGGNFAGSSSASYIDTQITPTLNFSGTGNYTALYINPTETAAGSGTNYLINAADGGASKLVLMTSGNVGIGTTAPATILDIYSAGGPDVKIDGGNGTSFVTLANAGTDSAQFGIFSGATYLDYLGTLNFRAGYNGSTELVLTSTGSVGIGTTTPQAARDVNGAARVGSTAASCSSTNAGAVQYTSGTLEACNGTSWIPIDSGMHFISTQTASSSASLQFTNLPTSYNTLFLNCAGLMVSSASSLILFRVGEGAGPTWETSGNYRSAWNDCGTAGCGSNYGTSATDAFDSNIGYNTTIPSSIKVYIDNIGSSSLYKTITWNATTGFTGPTSFYGYSGWAYWANDTNAVTGIELVTASGTITSGTCSLYGMN
jgi:hypothetical protein